jgi:hypothetical protein
MHEFENKGIAKWVPRKCLKRKGRFFLGGRMGETQNRNGSGGRGKERFGESCG